MKPVVPFEPKSTNIIPKGDHWIAQVKWDGVRILTYFDGVTVKLFNRKLNERTLQFTELVDIHNYCTASSVILDGEVIALDQGIPSFHEVMKRDSVRTLGSINRAKESTPIVYMIFDILYFNGNWVTKQTLKERQNILNNIIKPNESIQLVPNFANGESLFQVIKERGMEGVVMKDLTKSYILNGKDERWLKLKNFQDLHAVIGGVTFRAGVVNSLLLGLYDEHGKLWYIGHAGTGKFTQSDWRNITEIVKSIQIQEKPFVNQPERAKEATWVEPKLVVKVNYMEWTRGQTLRQPSIQGFSTVPIHDCTFSASE